MRCLRTASLLVPVLALACIGGPEKHTIAELRDVEPDMTEVRVENGLDQAMIGYRKFLEEAPESALTPEAMRRLADLKLEKQYGILGGSRVSELPAPETSEARSPASAGSTAPSTSDRIADHSESESEFERRAAGADTIAPTGGATDLELPGGASASSGPLEAIALYDRILAAYPDYPHNDRVLYQKARAFDELGRNDEAIEVIDRLIARYPHSTHIDEVHFRRAEYFFTRRKFLEAEDGYSAVVAMGPKSQYYELALYKLGWTLYKQELHEEALDQYVALLDYKVSVGYDFDQTHDEGDERRIADTFRVISLSFSNLGGPEAVQTYFASRGNRGYEDRIYSHLGEFYLEKLRYNDAAKVYEAFVDLYPLHRSSPHFSMRIVEIYEAGGFPKLVLESKKEFAATYGLQSEYWRHFDVADSPEVLSYLKSNLEDLASHYHSVYQERDPSEDGSESFAEALRWYRAYLGSFPAEVESPGINHRLADLLLEHEDFTDAAVEYERTAYAYPAHEKSAAAGYAAIYAYREAQKRAKGEEREAARRAAVTSTLRFADGFPQHEHVAAVLGAAVDDLYEMKEYDRTIEVARRLIDTYPQADPAVLRAAWTALAHASFDIAEYPQAEAAYARVLEMTPEEDESHQALVDNLAASVYKQGEQASLAEDHRTAADHFLRIARVAPTSTIRPVAEYDAGAALMKLKDWPGAAAVFETFRQTFPDHELHREATKQMAFVYREEGDLGRAATEYERVAREADDPELRREALLLAGELYEDAELPDRALAAYVAYLQQFPEPLETAVETRFKVAELHEAAGDRAAYLDELREIIRIDRTAGDAGTPRIRYLAARSALVLAEGRFDRFVEVRLVQPFERSLQEKQHRMNAALESFRKLLDYEVGEVTAAATYYMAEVYDDFSRALLESERPNDLEGAELQDYEMVLEEEAFPFEERAIDVHEKNLELMSAGVYNRWIERSLDRLAALMPGRYAKSEESPGWLASIDTYAYEAPAPPQPEAPAESLAGAGVSPEPGTAATEVPALQAEATAAPAETEAEVVGIEAAAIEEPPGPAAPADVPDEQAETPAAAAETEAETVEAEAEIDGEVDPSSSTAATDAEPPSASSAGGEPEPAAAEAQAAAAESAPAPEDETAGQQQAVEASDPAETATVDEPALDEPVPAQRAPDPAEMDAMEELSP